MNYKIYTECEESGVEWLGKVPSHWKVRRLKFVARYQNSNVDKKSHEGQRSVRLCNYTDVYYNEKITNDMDFMMATATDAEIESMSLKEDDVVITKDSEDPADIGIPALVSEPLDNVVCGYHLTVLRAKERDAARYLHRAIQSHPTRAHFFVESPGVTRFGLNQDAIGNLVVAVPPATERKQIATFLDKETTRIDTLIEKKARFIELLKEKRQALIDHTVTNGLELNAPIKESGEKWLGNIPTHWDVVPTNALFVESKERAHPSDEHLSATQKYGVIPLAEYERLEGRQVTHAFKNTKQRKHVEIDYFVISMRSFEGGIEHVKARGSIRSSYVPIIAKADVHVRYFSYLFKSKAYIQGIQATAAFIRDGQDLNYNSFRQVKLPYLSIDEQKLIADFLDREIPCIDLLTERIQLSIELLKERRSALISAAVTGQIDLREAAA